MISAAFMTLVPNWVKVLHKIRRNKDVKTEGMHKMRRN
jgi:hypothetical protein